MRIRCLTALLSAALIAPAATALTIDNFEEGDFSVVDTAPPLGSPTAGEQSGLAGTNAMGGVRLVRSTGTAAGTATAALVTSGADDGALLSTTGEGTFNFIYDGVAGGTSNGTLGTLNLDLSTFSTIEVIVSTPVTGADIRLTMWDSAISRSTGFQNLVNGVNSIAIDGGLLALNLADIKALQIAITDIGPSTSATIFDISAVPIAAPEPSTGLLVLFGLTGVAAARRR